jgi:pentatricopeptide repeat protein
MIDKKQQALLLLAHLVVPVSVCVCQWVCVHAFEVEPNTRCYNAAMTACAKAKQWQYPLKLLDVMQRRGVRLGHWLQDKSKRERD